MCANTTGPGAGLAGAKGHALTLVSQEQKRRNGSSPVSVRLVPRTSSRSPEIRAANVDHHPAARIGNSDRRRASRSHSPPQANEPIMIGKIHISKAELPMRRSGAEHRSVPYDPSDVTSRRNRAAIGHGRSSHAARLFRVHSVADFPTATTLTFENQRSRHRCDFSSSDNALGDTICADPKCARTSRARTFTAACSNPSYP
jgi:hypothetical protein